MAPQGEGKDVQLFRAVCINSFEKIAKSVSEERFVQLFRPIVASTSRSKKLYQCLKSELFKGMQENLNCMITEEKLDEKFKKKAELLEKQKEFEGTTAWRPTGDPSKDQLSHDMQVLLQLKAAMEEYLGEKQPYLDNLRQKVQEQRKEAVETLKTIHYKLEKIEEDKSYLDDYEENALRVYKALASLPNENNEDGFSF